VAVLLVVASVDHLDSIPDDKQSRKQSKLGVPNAWSRADSFPGSGWTMEGEYR
jgi:hypothetical protein